MKNILQTKNRKLFLLFICSTFSFLFATNTWAANEPIKVQGTVVDGQGEVIPGVNVIVKGIETGVITNLDGKYTIQVPSGDHILRFSYIGYTVFEVPVNNRSVLNVTMHEDVKIIDEVVVIGYGKTTKKELTGAISSLKTEDFNQGSFSNAAGLLQGKVAGLSILNPNGSDPQANYQILLRGTNTLVAGQGPLVVIDGVAGGDMKNINFQEVESIDILKDGSAAAIYGTRGTNGVLIITTKRAKKGKTTVEYQGLITAQTAPRMVKNLSADEFRTAINTYSPGLSSSIYSGNTDWFREVIREIPISHKHNFAISGGNDQFSHRTVINLEQNQGLQKNNDLKKLLIKTNIQQKAIENLLSINYNAFCSMRSYHPANYDIFYQAFIHNPTEPIYDPANKESGGYTRVTGISYNNPVAMLNEQKNSGETDDFGGNVRATLDLPFILKGLKWDNFISYEKSRWETNNYYTHYYPSQIENKGVANISNGTNSDLQYESSVNFSNSWNKHTIQTLAGYTYQELSLHESEMSNSGFDTDMYETNNIGAGTGLNLKTARMSSNKEASKLISFFGRAIYNFDEKYMLSASVRREGSSRFGINSQWGWFPAVSVGWRLNKEEFMRGIDWITEMKLRAGYGTTGNQDFSNYKSLILMGTAGKFYYNEEWINSYQPVSNPNPDLRWEKKHEINAGIDFSLIKNKISGSIDYYYRKSTDLLNYYKVSVPPYIHTEMFTNVGTISNQGIEMTLSAEPFQTKDFRWNTDLTFSRNTNKLIKFRDEEFINTTTKTGWLSGNIAVDCQRMEEGQSLGTFYGPVWLGVDEFGNDKFKNQMPDGKVPESKWEKIGNAYPDFVLGWSNNFSFKSWDLALSLRASIGGNILNSYRLYYENKSALGLKNILRSQLDNANFTGDPIYSSKYLENGTFLKMDNISIGYNFNIKSKYISKVRVYGAAQDIFCLTAYKGVNPEVSMTGLAPGIERMTYYPVTTGLTFGVNVTF